MTAQNSRNRVNASWLKLTSFRRFSVFFTFFRHSDYALPEQHLFKSVYRIFTPFTSRRYKINVIRTLAYRCLQHLLTRLRRSGSNSFEFYHPKRILKRKETLLNNMHVEVWIYENYGKLPRLCRNLGLSVSFARFQRNAHG